MVTTTLLTATDLARLSACGGRYELIRGELKEMSPVGEVHGRVVTKCARYFDVFVSDTGWGIVYTGDIGIFLERDPDTIRAPDLAFIRAERLPLPPSESSYIGLIPDWLLEVVSPYDTLQELDEKIAEFLARGTRVALKVDPRPRTVTVHRKGQAPVIFHDTDVLEVDDLFPGLRLPVSKLFE